MHMLTMPVKQRFLHLPVMTASEHNTAHSAGGGNDSCSQYFPIMRCKTLQKERNAVSLHGPLPA